MDFGDERAADHLYLIRKACAISVCSCKFCLWSAKDWWKVHSELPDAYPE